MNADLQIRVAQWRQKAIDGTLTLEDKIEATAALREGRRSAAMAVVGATAKRAKAAGPAVSGDDLLDELMG
jgi:hypothetical protein